MTRRVQIALAAGSLYAALFLVVTGTMAAPASGEARLLLGHLYLFVPTLAAAAATAWAARASLGAERVFWSLLAGAAAAQMVAEGAFLLYALAHPGTPALLGLGHAGHYTFSVFVAVSILVAPHRPLAAARLRAAAVEWTMVAVAAYFLIFYFVSVPFGEQSYPWFWIFTVQQVVLAAGFGALALAVPTPPFATVYRILAAGFGLAAVAGVVPNWRYASGPYEAYSPANVDWILTLAALFAAAAGAARGPSWVPGREEGEAQPRRGWLMAAAVMLPLSVDVVTRLAGAHPQLAASRSQVALAATGVLLALAAVRVRRPEGAAEDAAAQGSTESSTEYLHFATGVAHELNNPLMAVGGWAELALRKSEPRESLEALLAATRRATQAVQRLQQLGRAAEPASAVPATADDSVDTAAHPPRSGPSGLLDPQARRWALLTLAFGAAFFAVTRVQTGPWATDGLLALPAAWAALALWRRAGRSRSSRRRSFWRLLAAGAAVWAGAHLARTALDLAGVGAGHGAGRIVDALYLAFLVPMIAALGLRAHPRSVRKDPAAVPDAAFIAVAAVYVFVRVFVLSALTLDEPWATRTLLKGALCGVVAVWAAVLWRGVESPSWRRAYGALAVFAAAYALLGTLAAALAGQVPAPGGWADVAAFVPFAVLVTATWAGRPGPTRSFPALLAAGAGSVVVDLLLSQAVPAPLSAAGTLTTACVVLLAAAAAVRLRWQVEIDRRTRREARVQAEEAQRAGRLTALASLVAAAVGDLEDQLEDVSRRARAASVVMPQRGEQMLQQARRARDIVREMSSAFRLVPPGPRRDLELAPLLEDVVESALDEGLPLHVSLEGLAGLPPVHGDARALSAAVSHLLRNAAQATPGGVLRIRGAHSQGEITLRFLDDGPGVPPALRGEIFDPFFTTRRVGEGVGLGLTLVHFVARGHGGSIVLEDSPAGACFVLRLPAYVSGTEAAVRASWPFVAAALLSSAVAILMAVEPRPYERALLSVSFQVASGIAAAAAMAWAAWRHRASRRTFWAWMAAGAGLWAFTPVLRVVDGGLSGPEPASWTLLLYATADLCWAAALLLRPDRRHERPSARLGLSLGAALCLFAYAQLHLLVLPDLLADASGREQLVFVRTLAKVALAAWAAVLGWRALSPYWRGVYGRLAAVLGAWAVGQGVALAQRVRTDYAPGGAADLGWIVPFLCLAALALYEAGRPAVDDEPSLLGERARPQGSGAWLVAIAVILVADALVGADSGHPALDGARAALTRSMVVVMALLLAVRELLAAREGRQAWRGRFPRDAGPSRWARLVGSAVHEMGSHLSSITALARLLLSQADASPRARADAMRLHERAEAATRVVRNLLAALPSSVGGRERMSVNRLVEDALEARRAALDLDGIALSCTLARDVPDIPIDPASLRHVLVALLDRAGVAIRASGGAGRVEVATSVRGEAVLITVGDSAVVPRGAVLARLVDALLDSPEPRVDFDLQRSLVRESIERQGGSLAVGHRPGGGTEFVVRLPIPATDVAGAPPAEVLRSGTD
ncbi:MAG TPA: ATP-binding protein [Vicinamibacteria bacterium]|nr:ATP-binding protein [Vicinamibacteria bacterium]